MGNFDFVELLGTPGASLDGHTLVAVSGEAAPGEIRVAVSLDGLTLDGDGFGLIANAAAPFALLPNSIQVDGLNFDNSSLTLFVVQGFTGNVGDDLDTNDDGTLNTMPWTSEVASLSLAAAGVVGNYGTETFDPDGDSFVPASGARNPDETGDFELQGFFALEERSPGFLNAVTPGPDVVINEYRARFDGNDIATQGDFVELLGEAGASH